jgi:hypothetical protein
VETAGHDKTVSAVVATPGGNSHSAGMMPVYGFKIESGRPSPGIFHEHPAGNAEGVDGFSIHPLHFICRHQVHSILLIGVAA